MRSAELGKLCKKQSARQASLGSGFASSRVSVLRPMLSSLTECALFKEYQRTPFSIFTSSQERKRALLSGTQFHLKGGKRCAVKPKPRRKQGVIKTRPEVNEIEKKRRKRKETNKAKS